MNTQELSELRANADAAVERVVKENNLAVEALTEKQIVELLKQVFASGDIIRNAVVGSGAQSVVYIPFAAHELLSGKLRDIQTLCDEQHDHVVWVNGALVQSHCECGECRLKRRIRDIASFC